MNKYGVYFENWNGCELEEVFDSYEEAEEFAEKYSEDLTIEESCFVAEIK